MKGIKNINKYHLNNNETRISLLELDCEKAKAFFLKPNSYCTIDLPPYFVFSNLLKNLSTELGKKTLESIWIKDEIKKLDDVNYILYTNKDGDLSWPHCKSSTL